MSKHKKLRPLFRTLAISGLLAGLTCSGFSPALAQDRGSDNKESLLGPDFRVGVDGELNLGGSTSRENGSRSDVRGSFVSLSLEWKQKVRAVISGKIEEVFQKENVELNEDFDIAEFVQEAYIEIREVGGTPMAIVVGKHPIPFGQNVQAMPLYKNNPLYNLQDIDEVYGVTLNLTEGLFGLFDQAEISAFETEDKDLKIGESKGMSIRLSKLITSQWLLTASHSQMDHDGQNESEGRTSIGLIGETPDGSLVGWAEGLYFSNNPDHVEANYGITVGGMLRVHKATDVIVEYNHIENEINQIALGVRSSLTRSLSIGAEVRYTDRENQGSDVSAGITLTYTFGNTPYSHNQEYLFDNNDDKNGEYLPYD